MQTVTIDDIDTQEGNPIDVENETGGLGKEEQKSRFIHLRAKGNSFAKIAKELKVSKGTLSNWSQELEELISSETDGQSVGTNWKVRIDNAGVEVEITAGRRIITDEEGNSRQFDKSQNEWHEESLGHIETLLQLKPAEHECST